MKRKIIVTIGILSITLAFSACSKNEPATSEAPVTAEQVRDNTSENNKLESNTQNEADSFLLEMINLSEQGWKQVNDREFDQAKATFEEIISHEKEVSPNQTYLDDLERVQKDYEERKALDPSVRMKLVKVFPHIYESVDYVIIDAYAGIANLLYHTEGLKAAGIYLNDLYKEKGDERLRTLKELYYTDGNEVDYQYGRISDSFIKENCEQLIPEVEALIDIHCSDNKTLYTRWRKSLAQFYYMMEDFDTYLDIYYDGQNVDEIEPVVMDENSQMTNLEEITYGLRWNEEKEEFERFTLARLWAYAEAPCKKEVFCDVHGRIISEPQGLVDAEGYVERTMTYDEDGHIIGEHYDSVNIGFTTIEDIIDIKYVWIEYNDYESDEGKPALESRMKNEERPFYLFERYKHSETYIGGVLEDVIDYEDAEYIDRYGYYYNQTY